MFRISNFVQHIPVLLEEVIQFFSPFAGGKFIDATVGYGGHAFTILERIPESRVLGIDADASALAFCEEERKRRGVSADRFMLAQGNFRTIDALAEAHGFTNVQGILLDLGVSSGELDDASRGFSFLHDGPLDMRFDVRSGITAAAIIHEWPAQALEKCFREYGEERHARFIAEAIVARRREEPFASARALAAFIATLPVSRRRGRIHPATRVFQALRILVNDELGALRDVLPRALALLAPEGRLVTIAFHSLEDRIIKEFAKKMARVEKRLYILTKHVLQASREEEQKNPRSRSAKLRALEKI